MSEISLDEKMRYYNELALRLKGMGFGIHGLSPLNYLMVDWQGKPLCQMNVNGECQYQPSDVSSPERETAKNRVVAIGRTVAEYMRLMEQAPQLKASGLTGDYRTLADFGGAVLAGHPTQYGVEFVTWAWNYDRKGVSHGHYFEHGAFAAAKQDFAVRAGLVLEKALFTPEQLSDLDFCINITQELDDELTSEACQRLSKLGELIKELMPSEVNLKPQQEQFHSLQMGGMA